MTKDSTQVAVIFGGPSPEHDVSILTGLQASRELLNAGYVVSALYWTKTGDWFQVPSSSEAINFLDGLPAKAIAMQLSAGVGGGFVSAKKKLIGSVEALPIDVALICCHGGPGEDGSLQAALDLADISYTGPDVAGAALGMDKLAFGAVAASLGLPVLPRQHIDLDTAEISFPGPYILKPRFGGSSIGIEVVDSVETARSLVRTSPYFRAGAVVEPYRSSSYDLNVAVRRYPAPQLSAIEKPTRTNVDGEILGYNDKYIGGEGMVSAPRELPAELPQTTEQKLRKLALQIAEVCGVRGVQRIDFLCDGVDLYVNEINTIPGSLAKHLWVDPPISFLALLEDMIGEASSRPSKRWTSAGADGSALRSAGDIGGKLS